jgi:hypothetical protein
LNQVGDASLTAISIDGGTTWTGGIAGPTASAYEVDGHFVPEPSSIALVLGSGSLLGVGRKLEVMRKKLDYSNR